MRTKAATEALIDRYIERDPLRPGADDARLIGYGYHIWALIGHLHAIGDDLAQMAADYGLPMEAAQVVEAYYQRYKNIIDGRLALHEDLAMNV